MAVIRRELHHDVRQVVQKAEAATDWQRYIRMYPWAFLGLACAAGYAVAPRRRRALPRAAATTADVAEVRAAVQETRKADRAKTGLLMAAWAALSPVAIRLAQGYAVQYLENWLLDQQQAASGGPPPPPSRQAAGPGGARSAGGF
jgi:hypothetical protein